MLCRSAGFSSSKGLLKIVNKIESIVKVFDIVPFIPLGAIPGLAYKVFNDQAFTFSYCALIKKAINFKGLVFVSVILYKY